MVEATAGADEWYGFVGGGDDRALNLLTLLVETCRDADTVRLSWGNGSTGHNLSLRSEFCRLKVACRGKPVIGRSLSFDGRGNFCWSFDKTEGHGEMSSQPSSICSGL